MASVPAVRAALAAAVLTVLTGLLGMHGLADGIEPVAAHSSMGTSVLYGHSPGVTADLVMPAHQPVSTAVAVADPSSCGMDHAGCVAVLRAEHHPGAPGAPLLPAAPLQNAPAHVGRVSAGAGSRGPPSVSLTGLGISRT